MDETCIVITGLINEEYVSYLLETYKNVKNKIISTWLDQDKILIEMLRNNKFIIVQDNFPINNTQTNYQSKAIRNGCLKAKELGYKYVIRLRTDMISDSIVLFIQLLEKEFFPKEKLVSFCGIETQDGVYFYDIMIGGRAEQIFEFFKNEQSIEDTRYIEKFLLESYLDKMNITREDVKGIFNFCFLHCCLLEIEFFLLKYKFNIINEYCTKSFVWI